MLKNIHTSVSTINICGTYPVCLCYRILAHSFVWFISILGHAKCSLELLKALGLHLPTSEFSVYMSEDSVVPTVTTVSHNGIKSILKPGDPGFGDFSMKIGDGEVLWWSFRRDWSLIGRLVADATLLCMPTYMVPRNGPENGWMWVDRNNIPENVLSHIYIW